MSENKNTPLQKHLINQKAGERKASLKRLAYGKYPINNGFNANAKDVANNDPAYTLPQDIDNFDLWVTEINYGYGLIGQNAASRFYNKFYAQYFRKDPLQVTGVSKDELEYNQLAKFIRETQVNATIDHNNLLLLEVPGAGIRSIGMVSAFQAGVSTQNQGIPVAPEFKFEFIVFRDLTDAYDSQYNKNTHFSYFTNAPSIKINEGEKTPAIFTTDEGSIKPFTPSEKPTPPKRSPTEGINGGTNGAKGAG